MNPSILNLICIKMHHSKAATLIWYVSWKKKVSTYSPNPSLQANIVFTYGHGTTFCFHTSIRPLSQKMFQIPIKKLVIKIPVNTMLSSIPYLRKIFKPIRVSDSSQKLLLHCPLNYLQQFLCLLLTEFRFV